MNITSILRLQTFVVFIGLGFISPESTASKTADKSVHITPKLSQGPNFQVFTLVASQGHGRSLVRILPEKSYYQRGLVLPASSMRMTNAEIDKEMLKTNERKHPNKVGLLDRPTLIVGGKLSHPNNSPHVDFMQLRLPHVRLKGEEQPVRDLYVKAKVVGGQQGISGTYTSHYSIPVRTLSRVPWKFGHRLPVGLPDHKTSQLLDFDMSRGGPSALFAYELYQAIERGGTLNILVFEDLEEPDFEYDYARPGKQLYEINYTFKGEPHDSAEKYLHAIIRQGIDDLANGKGRSVGGI